MVSIKYGVGSVIDTKQPQCPWVPCCKLHEYKLHEYKLHEYKLQEYKFGCASSVSL